MARAHLLPHFTRGVAWDRDDLVVVDRGEGCYVWDEDGNRYLDGLSGLFCTNLGHGRSDLGAAALKQMDRLAFYPTWGFANPPAAEAARLVASVTPGDLDEIFFVNSGSEAVESAVKLARSHHLARGDHARHKVIAREWAYHGTTLGALALTGIDRLRDPYLPLLGDIVRRVPNTHGCATDGRPTRELACVRAIEDTILAEGPDTVAMVIAEPVQNGRGALVPPDGYWQELRRICDEHGVLLCADEVINGFGRLGHWFGSERMDVVPDLLTFAKGVTSAYAPLGGMAVRRPIVERIWESDMAAYLHGSTFGGHPVSTAVAVATIQAMHDEAVPAHVLAHEAHLGDGLHALAEHHDCVREVRGTGFFHAIELMASRSGDRPLAEEEAAALTGGVLAGILRDERLLVRPDDRGATMLAVSPPLVAGAEVLDDLLDRLDRVLDRTSRWIGGDR